MTNEATEANEQTRLCSRCRQPFPRVRAVRPGQPEEWWLCPPCHARLIGKGSRPGS